MRLWIALWLLLAGLLPAQTRRQLPPATPQWGVWEQRLTAGRAASPDLKVEVRLTRPGGGVVEVDAFWDGGREWMVRFSPDLPGDWTWRVRSSDRLLNRQSGKFKVEPAEGTLALRLSADRRYLVNAEGKPFFWLADTAWNGAIRATDEEWTRYLADRKGKAFTGIQFVMTQWRAAPDANAFTAGPPLRVNPEFFRRMDRRFAEMKSMGLVPIPVMLWAIRGAINPGDSLPNEQAVQLARYLVARYSAYRPIWILAGDGDYRGERAEKWKQIGRAAFPPGLKGLVTMHPGGMQWPWEAFEDEWWLDIITYQSGHGNNEKSRQWNAVGVGELAAKLRVARPVINAEPNYETHLDYHERKPITDYQVRRAAYWSLLATPPAGVTYGAHGIWFWSRAAEVPTDHERSGVAMPWPESLNLPGARQMRILRQAFESIEWWRLRPDPDLVAERADDPAFLRYVAAARTENGDAAMLYIPDTQAVTLRLDRLARPARVIWIDPQRGFRMQQEQVPNDGPRRLIRPGEGDWALVLDAK